MIPRYGCLIELSRAVIMFMSECPCSRHPEVRVISLLGLAALSPDAETATNSSGTNILSQVRFIGF